MTYQEGMAQSSDPRRAILAAVPDLVRGYSLEVTPREPAKHPGLLADLLSPGSRVYVTYLAHSPFEDTVAATRAVHAEGLIPVPKLAARSIEDLTALDTMVGQLVDAGADELLVIAGSVDRPAGSIVNSAQVLESGVLQRRKITRVGIAGHPEGSKDIPDPALHEAMTRKNRFALETGIPTEIVTQFVFDSAPVVTWERRIRAAGNTLPIKVGLPGLTTPPKLLKYGSICGVGPSLKVLSKQSGGLSKMATAPTYRPDRTIVGVTRSFVADPGSLISGIHLFPFGALRPTCQWLDTIAAANFIVTDNFRLEATG